MRSWPLVVVVALGACQSPSHPAGDDDPVDAAVDAAVDTPDGVGCTAMTPRVVPLQAFVGPMGLQQRMVDLIDSAQSSLELQMYLFTVDPIADRIIAAHHRGVAVRVILDPDHPATPSMRSKLMGGGVNVRTATQLFPYSHAKYLIVDRKLVSIMSMNFNFGAMSKERNYGVIDQDPEDVADTIAIFEMDWAAGGGETPNPANLDCTRLIIAPTNAHARILDLINGAKSTLDVEAFYISDDTVRDAIAAATGRGVSVRVILEDPSGDQSGNAQTANYFHQAQIPVHYVIDQFYLHAKLIVADGVAFIGSENFSVSGLTKNRELGVMAFEPGAAGVATLQFDADWSATPSAF